MKRKFVLVMCILMMFTGAGCSTAKVEKESNDSNKSMFVLIEDYALTKPWKVVYHRETKVMYVISFGGNAYGIFTPLLNPDGSPMLWEGNK